MATESQTRRHLRAGWIGLLVYLGIGIALETLHGFKASLYLDVGNENRRLMWTLAHAHGTLFSLIQLAAAFTVKRSAGIRAGAPEGLAWWGLLLGQVLMPLGFLLGGVWLQGGEPGLGVFLVPVGAAAMLTGVSALVWKVCGGGGATAEAEPREPTGEAGVAGVTANPSDRQARTPTRLRGVPR